MNKLIYEIVYLDKDGNYHDTNIEYHNKSKAIEALESEVGNCKEMDMDYIQLYKSLYNSDDKRVQTKLIKELKINAPREMKSNEEIIKRIKEVIEKDPKTTIAKLLAYDNIEAILKKWGY